jgi:CxxC motif-containing protein (DUF1111 family)
MVKTFKLTVLGCFIVLFALSFSFTETVRSQKGDEQDSIAQDILPKRQLDITPTEAPTGFDNQTNGFTDQATFDADLDVFAEQEKIADGLGPVYNAQSCGECHQNPVTGGVSQIAELRAGHFNGFNFIDHPGGSLVHSRAINAAIQERVLGGNEVRAFRMTTNALGNGFVEAIDSNTLLAIARSQPFQSGGRIAGQLIQVPVIEANGAIRAGRFGWKNQHASLVSFAADAYLNEMGITTPFLPTENTSNGNSVAAFDTVADPEDDGVDVEIFARFMRATKAPPRDAALAATPDAQAGEQLFNQIGCNICHVNSITTAPAGTVINQGSFTVPPALGDKIIHPFGDFLLHDIGTGDGIVQNGGQSTRNKIRTAPLWGLRTRNRMMHDGLSLTFTDAILRHAGESSFVTQRFTLLSNLQRQQIITFLRSL